MCTCNESRFKGMVLKFMAYGLCHFYRSWVISKVQGLQIKGQQGLWFKVKGEGEEVIGHSQ